MTTILLTISLIAGIGALAGVILSFASVKFAVEENETAKQIEEVLPGANCGSCGFAGCGGYAAALADGKVESTTLCNPGGAEVAQKIAEILGVESGEFVRMTGVVMCRGNWDRTEQTMQYHGLRSCAAANQLFAGLGACPFGCIGLGDCAAVCDRDAITVENGLAKIDPQKCGACGKCASACPKQLISLLPAEKTFAAVKCKNTDKGALTRKECTVGCIGCGKCMKVCEAGAVKVENFNAKVDPDKCTSCGKCVEACPQKCIKLL